MKGTIKEQKGFAVVIALIGMAIASILGLAIISVASSNFKMTMTDGSSQSTYYIAEAGANYIIDKINSEAQKNGNKYGNSAEFFQYIESQFVDDTITFGSFEKNNGEEPVASITVRQVGMEGDARDYKIESVGKTGGITRTVGSVISVSWNSRNIEILDDLLFYASSFGFNGSSVNALAGCIVMDGLQTHDLNGGSALNVSNMYFNGPVKINGGSASFGSKEKPGSIYVNGDLDLWSGTREVYGDIRVNGKFRLKDAKIYGDAYVDGDVELGWTPEIHKNIYYTGNIIAPASFSTSLLAKCIKVGSVDGFEIPLVDYSLREDSWYADNGYIIRGNETGTIPNNAKMLVDNYSNNNWQDIKGQVVIVSKGDIILRGGSGFNGALIAPDGKVEYSGDGTFNGVIISKKEINLPKGGNHFNFKSLGELFEGDTLPVLASSYTGEGNDGSSPGVSKNVEVTIKSHVKEK